MFEGGKAQIFSQIFAFAGERIFSSRFGIGPKCSVISASIAEERVQKSSYVKLGEKVVCRKCYCNLRRVSEKCNGPGESAAASVASTSGEACAGMLNILIFFLALLTLNFVLSVFV